MIFQEVGANAPADEPAWPHPAIEPQQAPASVAEQALELINRYPNLSEIELARLIDLYRHLSALDMALMLSDETLSPKLDRFFEDHRAHIRTPFRQYAVLVAIALWGIAITAWAVAFGP